MKKVLIFLTLFIVFLFSTVITSFDKENVSIKFIGVEKGKYSSEIIYHNNLYTCSIDNQQSTYINGDEVTITCKNSIIPIVKKNFEYGIDSLLTNELDNKDVLLSQWKNRGIKNILAVFKTKDERIDNGSHYLTFAFDDQSKGVGYYDMNVLYDSMNELYVKKDKEGYVFDFPAEVSLHYNNIYSSIQLYEKEMNHFELIYLNNNFYKNH